MAVELFFRPTPATEPRLLTLNLRLKICCSNSAEQFLLYACPDTTQGVNGLYACLNTTQGVTADGTDTQKDVIHKKTGYNK